MADHTCVPKLILNSHPLKNPKLVFSTSHHLQEESKWGARHLTTHLHLPDANLARLAVQQLALLVSEGHHCHVQCRVLRAPELRFLHRRLHAQPTASRSAECAQGRAKR